MDIKNKALHTLPVVLIIIATITIIGLMFYNNNYVKGAVIPRLGDQILLARLIAGEADGEPYSGQVAVGSVILNRVKHSKFPNSVAGVVYQPGAFESVSNGHVWVKIPTRTSYQAAVQALSGWDPTYGCLYFWNPYKPVSGWIWSRQIVTQIGKHVFGK